MYSFTLVAPPENWGEPDQTLFGDLHDSIFLAGPCPRNDYYEDWRYEAFDILNELGFTGKVITPTNSNYANGLNKYGAEEALKQQTNWERVAMYSCSALVFWIPRSEKFPARTTNIEFGEWYAREGVFVGWPDTAIKNEYLDCKLAERDKRRYTDLRQMLQDVVANLACEKDVFFTSDTHFSQQRTLELSRRPFHDVKEMDLTMISNWNKRVRRGDVVFHAGDFMDPGKLDSLGYILNTLNFETLIWVLGNYDRKAINDIRPIVDQFNAEHGESRKVVLMEHPVHVSVNGKNYVVCHEPNDYPIDNVTDDEVILFGHIHGRAFAKTDGFDLGTDYHGFKPISSEQVEWFRNAMQYWDQNVFSMACNTRSIDETDTRRNV